MKRTLLVGGFLCLFAVGAVQASGPGDKTQQKGKALPDRPVAGVLEKDRANDPGGLGQKIEADQIFITNASHAGVFDVVLGRLAASRGTDPAVRKFGQQLVDAHRKSNTELKAFATSHHLTFPTEPSKTLRTKAQRLSQLKGTAFDRAIMQELLAKQSRDRALFQRTARQGTDSKVKAFATRTLVTVEKHQAQAQDITLKVMGTTPAKTASAKTR